MNTEFDFSTLDLNQLHSNENKVINQLQLKPQLSIVELAEILKVKNIQSVIHALSKKNIIQVHEEINERYKPRLVSYIKLNDEYLQSETKMQELFDQLEKKALKQLQALLFYLNKAGNINVLLQKNEIRPSGCCRKKQFGCTLYICRNIIIPFKARSIEAETLRNSS